MTVFCAVSFAAAPVLVSASPSLLMVGEGDAVEIACEAEGVPAPTVVWTKDGAQLIPTDGGGGGGDRVLVSRNRVDLRSIARSDAGLYACRWQNAAGSVTHHVKLVIRGKPSNNLTLTMLPL